MQDGFNPENYEKIFTALAEDSVFIKQNPIFFHKDSEKIAVIIDTRFDTVIQGVIRNFMYYMNPLKWNLMIYGLPENQTKVKAIFSEAIFREIPEEYISKESAGGSTLTIENYNKLFMSTSFWESMPCENICIFQRDCVMYKMFSEYFSQFYDYAGANFYSKHHIAPYVGGIQGGFSIRKRKCMLDCLNNITWDIISKYREIILKVFPGGNILGLPDVDLKNEDIFFTYACEILHKSVPDSIHRSFLSIESDVNLNTSVMHGWTKYKLPHGVVDMLLKESELLSKYYTPL